MTARLADKSDADLLELSISGDEAAFLLLYERLKTPLFKYAFYMTSSQAAAEEVVQEVFISLLRNPSRYMPSKGDLSGFVFGIARNLARRLKRREYVYEKLAGNDVLEKVAHTQEELSAQMIRNRDMERMRAAVASLPDHYRQVVVLCDLCELSYTEAAGRMQCAVGTVRSRLNRAHALLAQKLKGAKQREPALPSAGTEECLI